MQDEKMNEVLSRLDAIDRKLDGHKTKKADSLMTAKEVMEYLKITRSTFDKLRYQRDLPAIKIAGCVRVERDSLKKWIEVTNGIEVKL